jgi:hypothetical protein
MLITSILITAFTAVFSYAHGYGDALDGEPDQAWYESKGVLIALDVLLLCGLGVAVAGWPGLLAAVLSPYYWFLWRSGDEAHRTLSYQDRAPWGKFVKVWQFYGWHVAAVGAVLCLLAVVAKVMWLPLLMLPCAAGLGLVFWAVQTYRQDPGESRRRNRSRVELATGTAAGMCRAALFVAAALGAAVA